jgi:hypothetical protein
MLHFTGAENKTTKSLVLNVPSQCPFVLPAEVPLREGKWLDEDFLMGRRERS